MRILRCNDVRPGVLAGPVALAAVLVTAAQAFAQTADEEAAAESPTSEPDGTAVAPADQTSAPAAPSEPEAQPTGPAPPDAQPVAPVPAAEAQAAQSGENAANAEASAAMPTDQQPPVIVYAPIWILVPFAPSAGAPAATPPAPPSAAAPAPFGTPFGSPTIAAPPPGAGPSPFGKPAGASR